MSKKSTETKHSNGERPPNRARAGKSIYAFPLLLLCGLLFLGAADGAIPDRLTTSEIEALTAEDISSAATIAENTGEISDAYTAKLFGIFPTKSVEKTSESQKALIPCGDVFGIKFFTRGVVITSISEVESTEGILSPAAKAGLKAGDILLAVNGNEINTVEALGETVENCNGKTLTVDFSRDGNRYKAKLTPVQNLSDGIYKSGMWVRDSTAGIGTVTFYDPESGTFGGLGHGIYDSDTEVLMPLLKGAVVDIELNDVLKGRSGHPGELKGTFGSQQIGELYTNSPCGIFGVLNRAPACVRTEPMPIGTREELETGPAVILCDVDGNGVKEYDIEIVKIYGGTEETKNFVIEVTDPTLLSLTGGIVRGMSGSPILQNDKLVGAVTHVLVSDSHKGYGIFIENMLSHQPKSLEKAA